MLTQVDDGWAEYARRVLEREPSPQPAAEVAEAAPIRKGLRTALGWGKPGVEVPPPVTTGDDTEEDEPLTIFRM
jgi:hypothetical protein